MAPGTVSHQILRFYLLWTDSLTSSKLNSANGRWFSRQTLSPVTLALNYVLPGENPKASPGSDGAEEAACAD